MFVKINSPGNTVLNSNSGSCANLVDYLSKENDDKATGEKWENFFNQDKREILKYEARDLIDGVSKHGLKKTDSKYFMLTVNPSSRELQHLTDLASGHKKMISVNGVNTYRKTDVAQKELADLNSKEKELFNDFLKDYTNQVMDAYAMSFNKGLRGNDLTYFAKVEESREWNHKDKNIIENKNLSKDIYNLNQLKEHRNDDNLSNEIDKLKDSMHKKDGLIIDKDNLPEAEIKENIALLEQKQNLKEQLKEDPQNYGLKQELWELNKQMSFTDDKRMISGKIIKENELIQKQIDALENAIIIDSSKEDLIANLENSMHKKDGLIIDKDNLPEAEIKENIALLEQKQNLKEQLKEDSQNYGLKQELWELNKQMSFTDDKRMISGKIIKENELIQKQIDKVKTIDKDSAFEVINTLIAEKQALKHRDKNGNILNVGMKKEGLQNHVHVVVSRKSKDGQLISPMAKSKGHKQTSKDGTERTIGFNHEAFKVASAEIFAQSFGYEYKANEKYNPMTTNIAGKIKSKLKSQAHKQVNKVMGQEFAQAVNVSKQVIRNSKLAIEVGKDIAALVSGNPAAALNIVKKGVKKAQESMNMELVQKLKAIANGKALGM